MQVNELKNLHSWVRQTAVSEILFVSSLVLPAFILMYEFAAERVVPYNKGLFIGSGILIYVLGIIWMKSTQSRGEKDLRDLATIVNYVVDQGFTFMSFERIREINNAYTKDRVRELVFLFPNYIRFGTLQGGRKGIKVLNLERQDDL